MDPQQMAAFINSVPSVGGPAAPGAGAPPAPVFQPSAAPMFAPDMPQPPIGQPPAPTMPYAPSAPTWPQVPQYQPGMTPQPPRQPGLPQPQFGQVFAQPGQPVAPEAGQPGARPGEIPLAMPQLPAGQQAPDWAQQLMNEVAQLRQQQVAPAQEDKPWDQNNRPRTWEEMYAQIVKLAEKRTTAMLTQVAQEQQQVQVQQQQVTQAANQQMDMIEGQLTQAGLLPQVTNPADPNDTGRLARKELYAYALATGGSEPAHLGPAASALYALHQSGYYFDMSRNTIVQRNSAMPGAFAPIAGAGPSMGGGGGAAGGGQGGPTVREFATTSMSQLAAMGAARLGLS